MPELRRLNIKPEQLAELDETRSDRIKKQLNVLSKKLAKNSKKITIILVLIIASYFAYQFFIGSIKELKIYVQNVEGEPIETNYIKITDSSGNEVFKDSGLDSYTLKLRQGSYNIEVLASGFKKVSKDLQLNDSRTITIQLEKDLELSVESLEIPQRLYLGQEFILNVEVKNEESISATVELELGGALSDFRCELSEALVAAHSTQIIPVYCSIPNTISLKNNCEQKRATARIRYLKTKKEKTFELCKIPNISISDISFSVDPVARPKQRKDIVIKNRSAFPAEHMQLSIEITSAEKNDREEVAKWFSFSNATTEPKGIRDIAIIKAKETIHEPLEVNVPIWAKAETIYGNIVMNAPFLKEPKKSKLALIITKTLKVELKASISTSNISIYTKDGIPQEITTKVVVINNSDLPVENIDIKIENQKECSRDWLRPLDKLSIARIEPHKSTSIVFIASAPKDAKKNDVMRCILNLSYENPLPPNDIKEQNIGFVEIIKR